MTTMILYRATNACSIAAHIALAEAGLDFETRAIDLGAGQQNTAEYLSLNPKGRVPYLVDGAFGLSEVPAIMRYASVKGQGEPVWPTEPLEDARCAEWLAWISSTVHPAFAHWRRPYRYADDEAARAEVSRKGNETCRTLWAEVERKLAGRDYAVGDRFSVADAYLTLLWIWGRQMLGYDMEAEFPHWTRHARIVAERPAVRRVFEAEGLATP